jgi:branched-chain amino acid transport system permease protein
MTATPPPVTPPATDTALSEEADRSTALTGPPATGPQAKRATGQLPRWSGAPAILRHGIYAVGALVILLLIAGHVSRYRDIQISQIAVYLVVVAGLTVLTGINGQISLGHGALMAVGAYATALLLLHSHIPLLLILVASIVAGAVVGAAVGVIAARLRGPYLAGATLALAVGLPEIAKAYKYFGADQGLTVNPPAAPGWVGDPTKTERWGAYISIAAAVVVMLLLANLARSRYGRQFKAVRDDEIAASLAGIPVARTQVLAFIISAACAGLGGGLLALTNTNVGPGFFTLALSIQLLVAIVIGGMGSLTGAVIGAVLIVFLPIWSNGISDRLSLSKQVGANLSLAIFGAVLILVMLAFPGGVMGALKRLRLTLQRSGGR